MNSIKIKSNFLFFFILIHQSYFEELHLFSRDEMHTYNKAHVLQSADADLNMMKVQN